MAVLTYSVSGQSISLYKSQKVVSDSVGFIDAEVKFVNESDWDGLIRYICFYLDDDNVYEEQLTEDSSGCWVTEKEINLKAGTWAVSVYGYNSLTDLTKQIPTDELKLVVKKSGCRGGSGFPSLNNTKAGELDEKIAAVNDSKVGYAEYNADDSTLILYTDSTKETQVGDPIEIIGGSISGGMTQAQVKALIESYGYAVASDMTTALASKQDTISDLETIRSGAALGATALQSVPTTYRTSSDQDEKDAALSEAIVRQGERIDGLKVVTPTMANTLMAVLEKCAFITSDVATEVSAFQTAWGITSSDVTVSQNGSTLIFSGFTATSVSQNGSTLTIA